MVRTASKGRSIRKNAALFFITASVLLAVSFIFSSCISKDDLLERAHLKDKDNKEQTDDVPSTPSDLAESDLCQRHARLGFDVLGLLSPHTDAAGIAAGLPPNSLVGFLDTSFGTGLSNLETVLLSNRVTALRIHLLNAVCVRNRNCGPSDGVAFGKSPEQFTRAVGTLELGVTQNIDSRAKVFAEVHRNFPCVKFYVSPLLEHDEDEPTVDQLFRYVRAAFPYATIVNSPFSGSRRTSADLLELHGTNHGGNPGANSLDGESIRGLSQLQRDAWRQRNAAATYVLSWLPEGNCRPANGAFIPIDQRTECLTKALFMEQLRLTYE